MRLPKTLYNWMLASRPKTLPAAASPVIIGSAMAFSDGKFHALSALAALIGALLIQIGTNFANDYFDFVKGTDTEERIGPMRVTQAGLIRPETIRRAFILIFSLVFLIALYLFWRAGWVILLIAFLSILSGILYTGGPLPLGYIGLGDLWVLIFFGPVAVGGTYFVQALEITPVVILAGLSPGFISMAILTVNNLRDVNTDRRARKKTLAVRFGENFARIEYLLSILIASLIPVYLVLITKNHPFSLAALLTIVIALPPIKGVFFDEIGAGMNALLAKTGRVLLIYSLLFSIGWIL
ncbi:MAG: 1,4-dihydroxy-2-naphthoate polyprenyltransferase [bacterium]